LRPIAAGVIDAAGVRMPGVLSIRARPRVKRSAPNERRPAADHGAA
jgi:hypothetical protein